jgi:transcription-repair coupling factor (superfamily II helicase)
MNQKQDKITWSQLLGALPAAGEIMELHGLSGTAAAYAAAQVFEQLQRWMVIVVADTRTADTLMDELALFVKDAHRRVLYFPPYNLLAFKHMAYHNETAAHRIGTLYQLIESTQPQLVVTTVDALTQKIIPKNELIQFTELLITGEETDRDGLIRKLVTGGYTRAMVVEEPGDFSLRGGIVDLFSPSYPDPIRIEFFGDVVESIRHFSADTQRTIATLDEAVILPAREALISQSRLNQILGRIRQRASQMELPVSQIREMMQKIKHEGIFPGLESLLPLIYTELDTLFDYTPSRSLWFLMAPGQLRTTAAELGAKAQGSYQSAIDQRHLCLAPDQLYLNWSQVEQGLKSFPQVVVRPLGQTGFLDAHDAATKICEVQVKEVIDVAGDFQITRSSETPFQPLVQWLERQQQARYCTLIVCRRGANRARLAQLLAPYAIAPMLVENLDAVLPRSGGIYLLSGKITAGFNWPDAGVALISDEEIFGTAYRTRKVIERSKALELINYEDLKQGDWVVHAEHGIGCYDGLVKLAMDRSMNDYLLIVYRDDDKLYLPVERMGQVQKYIGVDGVAPVMDKMGGKTWERVKAKIKRTTEKMAGELLKLYAARKARKGHAFGNVDTFFQDFEDGFPFEETADQRKAIETVLDDMRQEVPMDRLVCGDVGYGKTEVALRAAFLAVSDAKQVALLVPTTVLAEQHLATFQERFKRYPVQIACMSRFRSPHEQRLIVAGLKEGTVDIVIGTHRLLQKDIAFKELGLLILDEEQRFGVRHKEKIKSLRETVDVLTLTATPIPRTLHLSLLGIRDVSLISTPPEQRRPIVTYICEMDDLIIAEAIRKELSRGGQMFFVHNHIGSIERMADHVQLLVPEVKLAVAHGRMDEDGLEQVMLDFMQRRVDLLVCTTIIESGLDVSAANTIIINRADRFGLSQIYQLRGRVGRSEEQAYAYLFIPGESNITKDAQKRLKVLMEHSDLGSGFQIAMSDLRIRGGGTILGASQSGRIAAVGYDTFLKLMESSIAEMKGEPMHEPLEPEIQINLSAFIPEDYIPDIDQRLLFYRRLSKMTDLEPISAMKAEMVDRFGRLPDEIENLLIKIMLKILAVRAGCKRLDLIPGQLALQFSAAHQIKPFGIVAMIDGQKSPYRISPDHTFKAKLDKGSLRAQLAQVKNILIEIAQHVNQ